MSCRPTQRSTSPKKTASKTKVPVSSAPLPVAPELEADPAVERRLAELESQVASLTERLDAAVTTLAPRSGFFRRSRRH